MGEVIVRRRVGASADTVWDLMSNFGGLVEWNEGIESCTLEGEGVGAVRTLGMPGGLTIQERLETHEAGDKHYAYAIVGGTPLPFTDYLAHVRIEEAGDDACLVDWRSSFEAEDAAVATKIITGIYASGLAAVGKHLGVGVEHVD